MSLGNIIKRIKIDWNENIGVEFPIDIQLTTEGPGCWRFNNAIRQVMVALATFYGWKYFGDKSRIPYKAEIIPAEENDGVRPKAVIHYDPTIAAVEREKQNDNIGT